MRVYLLCKERSVLRAVIVQLSKQFFKSEDPTSNKSAISRTCWNLPREGNHRVIIVSCIGYAIVYVSAQMRTRCHLQPLVNLGTHGGVQSICTCTARAAYTPSPFSTHHLLTLVKQCQCAKFCVAGSTFPKIIGSPVKK